MAKRENFEGDSFEKRWRDAIGETAEQPPSHVWDGIERELALQQLKVLKQKNKVYQWAAAASIFIASLFGINYFISDRVVYTQVISPEEFNLSALEDDQGSFILNIEEEKPGHQTYETSLFFAGAKTLDESQEEAGRHEKYLAISQEPTRRTAFDRTIEANLDRDMHMNQMIISGIEEEKHSVKGERNKFWAGVVASSGSFDPNYQSGANNLLSNNLDASSGNTFALANSARIAEESPSIRESMKAGTSYALGLNFGMKITDKWVIESGVQYARSDITTQTNMIVESSEVVEPIAASSETKGVTKLSSFVSKENVVEYSYRDVQMDNQFQFATFPLKAGYLVVDGPLNIMVNAGVSTNIYLGNKLTDPSNEVANVSIGPGSGSPYREVSFTGIGGLQVGYHFLENFDVIVEPYLRQPITSLTKESTSFVASPSGLGINTGLRYRFN